MTTRNEIHLAGRTVDEWLADEAEAEARRGSENASAIRGCLFGIPLALSIYALPAVVFAVTGRWWVAALALAAEVSAVSAAALLARHATRIAK